MRSKKIWRRGSESNTPRLAKQTDSGFEDREGHQAPITLRLEIGERGKLPKIADLLNDSVRLGELAGGDFRINLLSINADFEHTPTGGDQPQRSDPLFELEQFVRQTDGMRLVVSSRAILDGNFQGHVSKYSKANVGKRLASVKERAAISEGIFYGGTSTTR
jgi:hypothetical protein